MPVITVNLTTGGTVYAASATSLPVSSVAIQTHRNNTATVYFDDNEAPDSSAKTGLEFAIPIANQQMPILGISGDNNPINLMTLKFTSATDTQKMTVFYKIL